MHGGAPRVRHREQTGEEASTEVIVDKDKLLSTIVTSAIGGIVGGVVTSAMKDRK